MFLCIWLFMRVLGGENMRESDLIFRLHKEALKAIEKIKDESK